MLESQAEMVASETIWVVVTKVAIQAATAMGSAKRQADAGPISVANTTCVGEYMQRKACRPSFRAAVLKLADM